MLREHLGETSRSPRPTHPRRYRRGESVPARERVVNQVISDINEHEAFEKSFWVVVGFLDKYFNDSNMGKKDRVSAERLIGRVKESCDNFSKAGFWHSHIAEAGVQVLINSQKIDLGLKNSDDEKKQATAKIIQRASDAIYRYYPEDYRKQIKPTEAEYQPPEMAFEKIQKGMFFSVLMVVKKLFPEATDVGSGFDPKWQMIEDNACYSVEDACKLYEQAGKQHTYLALLTVNYFRQRAGLPECKISNLSENPEVADQYRLIEEAFWKNYSKEYQEKNPLGRS